MTCSFDPQVCVMICACFCVLYGLGKFMKTYVWLYDHTQHSFIVSWPPTTTENFTVSYFCLFQNVKNWSQTSCTFSDWLLSLSLVHVGFLQGVSCLVVELPLLFNAIHFLHTPQFIYSFTLWLKKQSSCEHARISCGEASFQLLCVNTKKWWHSSSVIRFSLIDLFMEQRWFSNLVWKKSNWPINS